MKILIVSGAFFPEDSPRSFRTTELSKELSRLGHDVTVYIPDYDYDYSRFDKECPMRINSYKRIPQRRVFLGVSIIDRIIFHYENWLIDIPSLKNMGVVEKTLRTEKGYDLLITIAVPHFIHWAVGKLYDKGCRLAKTWVADCGDSFMLNKTVSHRPPFWFKSLEKRWCQACDHISVPLESEKENYYPEFKEKIRVIPQGFNFEDVSGEVLEPHNTIVTFAYAGSFIPKVRDPRPLLDFLKTIDNSFKLIIYTSNTTLVEPYRNAFGERLEIKKPIPRLDLIRQLRNCDFVLNIDNGAAKGMPSKLIDYALVGRPILSITSSNIDKNKIKEFLSRDYSGKYIVDNIEKYNIHNVAKQFLDLCK